MNRARLYINIKLLLLAVLTLNLSGCELDERVDDLTGVCQNYGGTLK